MRPTRFDLMLQYAREFIAEWFDQNPLGQIGVVGMRAGIGERIGEMSGVYPFVLLSLAFSVLIANRQPPRSAKKHCGQTQARANRRT